MGKILVVDDTPDILSTIKDFLKSLGYKIVTASNGKEAIGVYTKEKPDLVLLDIKLPDMNGFQVADKIPDAKILFFTGFTQYQDEAVGVKNCVGFITKPIDLEVLKRKIKMEVKP
jgi:CheY-like chemotaxis protein